MKPARGWPDRLVVRARELFAEGYGEQGIVHELAKEMRFPPPLNTVSNWVRGKTRLAAGGPTQRKPGQRTIAKTWSIDTVRRVRELRWKTGYGAHRLRHLLSDEMPNPPPVDTIHEWIYKPGARTDA